MNTNEWPLVFFSVLAQAGTGMVISLMAASVFFRQHGLAASEELRRGIILLAAVFTGIALMTSFLHLGQPAHSVYAVSGMGTSWLSREIVMAALFFALLAVTWGVASYTNRLQGIHSGWIAILAATGLFMIYTMIRLYMLPTIPVWNHISTPVAFLNTAHLLGPALFLVAASWLARSGLDTPSARPLITMLIAVILSGVIIHTLNATVLIPKEISSDAAFPPVAVSMIWGMARWFFLFVGLALMLAWVGIFRQEGHMGNAWLLYAGTTGLLLAELVARYLFYASYYRLGI